MEDVKPRSMSPTPQMTKLMMMSPMTTVMIALPTAPLAALRIDSSIGVVHLFRGARVKPALLAPPTRFAKAAAR